ncbi:hypothetical protein Tco_0567261 [Tanacetum coccineum]
MVVRSPSPIINGSMLSRVCRIPQLVICSRIAGNQSDNRSRKTSLIDGIQWDHHLSGTHRTIRPELVRKFCCVEIDKVKLVVEIESFGMSADELDKETGSSDGLQPKQRNLSCVHALNELHLHEIHVVPSKHEVDQYVHVIE